MVGMENRGIFLNCTCVANGKALEICTRIVDSEHISRLLSPPFNRLTFLCKSVFILLYQKLYIIL